MSWRARGGIQDSHQMIHYLLCPSTKASSLDGLIDSTFDVAFQGCNDLGLILPFISSQAKVVDYIECLSGEAELEGLYLLSCWFSTEARQGAVG